MSEPTKAIISDDQVEQVHANANFGGGETKRAVMEGGLVSYALGYSTGHTLMTILVEHGLIQRPRVGSHKARLTEKGFRYLRAMMAGARIAEVIAVMRGAA